MSLAKITRNSNQMSMEITCDISPIPSVTSMTSLFSEETCASSRSSLSDLECAKPPKKAYLGVEPCIIQILDLDNDSDDDSEISDEDSIRSEPEIYSPLKAIVDTYLTSILNRSPPKVQDANEEAILEYLHKNPATLTDVRLLIPNYGNMGRLTSKLATNIGLWHSKNKISAAEVETILEYLFTAPQAGKFVQFEDTHSNIAAFTNAKERDYGTLYAGADWEEARCPQFAPPILEFEHNDGKRGFWYEKNAFFEKVKGQIDRFQRQRYDNRGKHYEPERLHGGYGAQEQKMKRVDLPRKEKILKRRGVGGRLIPDQGSDVGEETDGLHLSIRKFQVLRDGEQHSFAQTAPSETEANLFDAPPKRSPPAKLLAKTKIVPCIPLPFTRRHEPGETTSTNSKPKPMVNVPFPAAYNYLSNLPIRPTPRLSRKPPRLEKQDWSQTRSLCIQKWIFEDPERGMKPIVRLPAAGGENSTISKCEWIIEESEQGAMPIVRLPPPAEKKTIISECRDNGQVSVPATPPKPPANKSAKTTNAKVAIPDLKKRRPPKALEKELVDNERSAKKPEWMVAPRWGN